MPPETTEDFWKDANVLIADDEPDMREILAAWLRSAGCQVTEVRDGKEALDALKHRRFDAIVTDVRMPRVTGIELVRSLHESATYTPVIIFVSGFVDLPLPDAYDLGVEAVLSKPCHRKDLVDALRRSIRRRNLIFEQVDGLAAPQAHDRIQQDAEHRQAEPVALGRGGVSLAVERPPELDVSIGFSLEMNGDELPSPLCGWGVVRWCEVVSEQLRAGIEFMYLEENSRESFARWLAEKRPASFIPKSGRARPSSRAAPAGSDS